MDIKARGYISNGVTKQSRAGASYNEFTLGVKQKDKAYGNQPEKVTWANLRVKDMSGGPLPADKAYVTIEGRLTVREFVHNGVQRTALEVFTKSVEVAPPLDPNGPNASSPQSAAAPAQSGTGKADREPWDPE